MCFISTQKWIYFSSDAAIRRYIEIVPLCKCWFNVRNYMKQRKLFEIVQKERVAAIMFHWNFVSLFDSIEWAQLGKGNVWASRNNVCLLEQYNSANIIIATLVLAYGDHGVTCVGWHQSHGPMVTTHMYFLMNQHVSMTRGHPQDQMIFDNSWIISPRGLTDATFYIKKVLLTQKFC